MRIVFTIFYIHLVVLITISSGCSEDLIQPSVYQFDSSRFHWTTKKINGNPLSSPWAVDTNNLFLIDQLSSSLVIMQNDNIQFIPTYPFRLKDMGGISSNEIYLAGSSLSNGTFKADIKKWDGGNIVDVGFNLDLEEELIYESGVYPDESWFCTRKHLIRFKDNLFTEYLLTDTNMYINQIYKSNNEFNFLSVFIDSANIWNYIYKFDGNNWIKTLEEVRSVYQGRTYRSLYEEVVYRERSGLFSLTGNMIAGFEFIDFSLPTGSGHNNILISGLNSNMPLDIYHWNGNKWSLELQDIIYGNPTLTTVNANCFIYISSSNFIGGNIIYIGTKRVI